MENQHLTYFKVENFKRFESLEMNNIGQFNLIVGDNNVGKTSVLEALLFDNDLGDFLRNLTTCLDWRHVGNYEKEDYDFLSLFFRDKNNRQLLFKYSFDGDKEKHGISLTSLQADDASQEDFNILKRKSLSRDPLKNVAKLVNINSNKSQISFQKEWANLAKHNYVPFVPFSMNTTNDLIDFYSENIQNIRSKRKSLIDSLNLFVSDIEDLEITTGIIPNTNSLIAWKKGSEFPFLINFFGQGTVKLLRYLLEIHQCKNRRIHLDEIEAGIHHTKMKDFFGALLKTSIDNQVQIFATTHSKEALQYYKEALEELGYQDKGRVIRLVEHKHKVVKAYTYTFEQFEQSLDNDNEIR